jgi:hypothetical protein
LKFSQFEESDKRSYSENSKMTCLIQISGAFRNPNFYREYLQTYSEPASKICTTCTPRSILSLYKFSRSEASQKISYNEISKMTCLKLISRAFGNPNFHKEYLQKYREPTSKIYTTYTPRYLLYLWKF